MNHTDYEPHQFAKNHTNDEPHQFAKNNTEDEPQQFAKNLISAFVKTVKMGVGEINADLDFIDKDVIVQPGDLVTTSPASILLPPNLPIGIVQSVDMRAVPSPQAVVQLIATAQAIDWVQVQHRH